MYVSSEVCEFVIVWNEINFFIFLVFPPLCSGVSTQVPSWCVVTCLEVCCFYSHGEQCLSMLAVYFLLVIDTVLPCDREPLPFCWCGHGRIYSMPLGRQSCPCYSDIWCDWRVCAWPCSSMYSVPPESLCWTSSLYKFQAMQVLWWPCIVYLGLLVNTGGLKCRLNPC